MINRRNFLGLGFGALSFTLSPNTLSALDFRKEKPKAWTSTKVDIAIKELFGTDKTMKGKIKLKAPDIAENGAVIPITVSSKSGNKVAIFQDANPEATVAVFTVPDGGIINYSIRIKMAKTGNVSAVLEDDGKLYKASKQVKVTIGGCGG